MDFGSAHQAGLDGERLDRAVRLLQTLVAQREPAGLSCTAGVGSAGLAPIHLGTSRLSAAQSVNDTSLFLVASLTKPIVAMGVLMLVERGVLTLDERVVRWVPEFRPQGKHAITLRQLLAHASGLPDQLPDNWDLREQSASLEEFYLRVCAIPPEYTPGTAARYQSMGYLVLGEIIYRATGLRLPQFLEREIFAPLGMRNSWLGLPADRSDLQSRLVETQPSEDEREAKIWNSVYWRTLGAPWGGLISTASDLARFLAWVSCGGRWEGKSLLHPALVKLAGTNQLAWFTRMNSEDQALRPWGLGWRLNWPAHRQSFGDFLPPHVIGHWGATGSLMWLDPATGRWLVALSTLPADKREAVLVRVSNVFAAAFR